MNIRTAKKCSISSCVIHSKLDTRNLPQTLTVIHIA